jgi:nitrate reductase NapE component
MATECRCGIAAVFSLALIFCLMPDPTQIEAVALLGGFALLVAWMLWAD